MQLASNTTGQRPRSDSTPYSPSPGSPTLTNPDMILPDYDDGTDSLERLQSPLLAWKNAHTTDMGFNLSPEAFTAGPITPTTPIIYGNGTMLSDIGEVTEVESTCGPSRSRSGSTRSEIAMVTSTALPYEAIKQRIKQARMAHQRQMSVDSNSTVTAHETAGLFVDFDDTVSVDDSNFQGDDEDSVAESYVDDASALENIPPARELSLDPDEARYSTPLSRRAEEILANAKRRLTTMEGNLNRARSSLYSPTMSSVDSQSTPSPPIGRPATSNGPGNNRDSRRLSNGHNRISSESNIPPETRLNVPTHRSLSALGTAGGYRRPLQGSRNSDSAHKRIKGVQSNNSLYETSTSSNSKISLHGQDQPLEPLSEDSVFEEKGTNGHDIENAKAGVYLSPVGSFSDKGLKRSVSSSQMRDIRDQVNDLKGRLSTLRDQARADSLKRRSLQSLRTPSPFTHARVEQWYADASSYEDDATQHSSSNVQVTAKTSTSLPDQTGNSVEVEEVALQSHDGPLASQPNYADVSADPASLNSIDPRPTSYVETIGAGADADSMNELDHNDDVRTEDGYEFAEADDFDESASESGASSYHDTVQAQVSHEDREDAFDYEHFFLHSAMGSMSRRRMRRKGSNDSFTSEDSVETTRGPATSQPISVTAINTGHRSRRGSAGSTSTMDSFATATEGRHTRVGIITSGEYNDEYNEYDGVYNDAYPEQVITLPVRARTHTPDTAKRMVSSPEASDSGSDPRQSQSSIHRRPQSSAAAFQHRPSLSSLSTGTNRSFPLIHKSRGDRGVNMSNGSPNQGLEQISETLMNETASVYEKNSHDGEKIAPMQMLPKDDQILVERLVASLGRCVLGLTEAGRASAEGRAYRRKIETAYRILEGFE
ncbi:hypothetical protein FHL15_000899 [Xylaria flabelliformis]|uniref:Uncharacterized protein n=1 Tax=Xylaria flabelliformis TaxID=2512241 RepID=A0A553IDI3_9PEZI|nr:hypothetical protein FHL15_000899 [Xylaria flabelliformis]